MSYFAELKLARLTPCAQYFHIRICGGVLFWFPKLAELIFSGSHLSPRFRTSLEPVLSTGKRNSSLVHGWLDHLRRRLRLYRLPWKRLTSLLLEHCTASTLSPNRKRPPFILWITQTKIKCFEWFFYAQNRSWRNFSWKILPLYLVNGRSYASDQIPIVFFFFKNCMHLK